VPGLDVADVSDRLHQPTPVVGCLWQVNDLVVGPCGGMVVLLLRES